MHKQRVLIEDQVKTVPQTVFDERKSSFIRLLHSCIDRIASDPIVQNAARTPRGMDAVTSTVDRIVSQYVKSEREVFLSYLLYLVQQSNVKRLPLPEFFQQMRSKMMALNERYDEDGELRNIFDAFKKNPKENDDFDVFISNAMGFFYETGNFHAYLLNVRKVVSDFVEAQVSEMRNTRKAAVQYLRVACAQLVESNSKVLNLESVLNGIDAKHQKEVQTLKTDLEKAKSLIKTYERFKLDIEGHVIRVLQHVEGIKAGSGSDPGTLVTLAELKKQANVLRKVLQETVVEPFVESMPSTCDNQPPPKVEPAQAAGVDDTGKDEMIRKLKDEILMLKRKAACPHEIREKQEPLVPVDEESPDSLEKEALLVEVMEKTDKLREYQAVKSELDELKQEFHAMVQQKAQADEYAQVMNKENIEMKKKLESLQFQIMNDESSAPVLQARLSKQREKVRALRERNAQLESELKNTKKVLSMQNTKLESMSVEYGTDSLRADLFIEQITNLKEILDEKDSEIQSLNQALASKKQELEESCTNGKGHMEEIEKLKAQVIKINTRKQRRDERIAQMQKVIDRAGMQMQEKDSMLEACEAKITSQRQNMASLKEKCCKASEIIHSLTDKISEQEMEITELQRTIQEAQKESRAKENTIRSLQESADIMDSAFQEQTDAKVKLFAAEREMATTQKKFDLLETKIAEQTALSEQYRNEVAEARKTIAEMQRNLDTVKFENEALVTRHNNEKKALAMERDQYQQQVEALEKERKRVIDVTEESTQEMKDLQLQYEERMDKLKVDSKERVEQLTEAYESQKAELKQQLLTGEEKIRQLSKHVQQLTNDLDAEKVRKKNDLEKYEVCDKTLKQMLQSDDVVGEVEGLQKSLRDAEAKIAGMNSQINRFQSQNKEMIQSFLNEQTDTSTSSLAVITSAFAAAVSQIQLLRDQNKRLEESEQRILSQVRDVIEVANICDVPSALQEFKGRVAEKTKESDKIILEYKSLFKRLCDVMSCTDEASLLSALTNLKDQKQSLSQEAEALKRQHHEFVESFREVFQFSQESELLTSVQQLQKEDKEKGKMIQKLKDRCSKVTSEKEKLQHSIEMIEERVGQGNTVKGLPSMVDDLRAKWKKALEQKKASEAKHREFVERLHDVLSTETEQEVVPKIEQLIDTLATTVANLKQKTSQLQASKKEAEENAQNYQNLVDSLLKVIKCRSPEEIPKTVGQLVEEKKAMEAASKIAEERHAKLISSISGVISFTSEDQIPSQISELLSSAQEKDNLLQETKKQHQTLVDGLLKSLNCRYERQILETVTGLVSQQQALTEELDQARSSHAAFTSSLRRCITFKDEQDLPTKLTEMVTEMDKSSRDLEAANKNIENMKASHGKFIEQIQRIVGCEHAESVVDEISKLVQAKDKMESTVKKHAGIFKSLHDLVEFRDEMQLPSVIENTLKDNKESVQGMETKLQSLSAILDEIKGMVPVQRHSDLPQAISLLIQQKDETEKQFGALQKGQNSLLHAVLAITEQDKQTDISSVCSALTKRFDDLEAIKVEHQTLMTNLQKLNLSDPSNILRSVKILLDNLSETRSELEDKTKAHALLVEQLQKILRCNDEKKIEKIAAELVENYENLQVQFEEQSRILTSLGKTMSSDSASLPALVENLKVQHGEMTKIISALLDTTEQSNQSQLEDAVKLLKDSALISVELIGGISSRMLKKQIAYSVPMNRDTTAKILKSFSEYADRHDAFQSEIEMLMSHARSMGFQGGSSLDAANFIADEVYKKKSQEQLERTVAQVKQLREDKERERAALEERNEATLRKLKEVRQSKTDLIEQSSNKQAELHNTIESLQKQIRSLESSAEHMTRVKEELVRLCSGEGYDKDSLVMWLTLSERQKLHL